MKPLFHPKMEDITVEAVLHALADPVRVAIMARIAGSDCARSCSEFLLVNDKPVPWSTLSQHIKALREAGLIRGERQGVAMHNTSRCAEVEARFPGLLEAIFNAHRVQALGNERTGRKAASAAAKKANTTRRMAIEKPLTIPRTRRPPQPGKQQPQL